ncbi:MAG: urea carboxylase [Acidimicrobiales bacterium]
MLVANRGEIAVRVLRTLRRMGVASVAVYTDADAGSQHVRDADEAVRIGDGPVATSYLSAERLLDATRATGADAVHPGYGFLSENADFALECAAAGAVFIGPEPDHLRRFGDKHEARELAAVLGVPLVDGSGLLHSAAEALLAAEAIGYPVMLKATAGGGGIGLHRCARPDELEEAFGVVTRLAGEHFKGGGVYVERLVARARHCELQLFGAGGVVVTLGARDCSAQRRHQKVIEETPPAGLGEDLLEEMRRSALRLGEAVGYRSAGTVEFVVDAERETVAFLEVNTRLQVEHGVTELVTGVDLVEWMVLEAAGDLDDLAGRAAALRPSGAAIEARIYAEDPAHGDRPGVGTLTTVTFPEGVRVDTWVEAGTEITPWYDPLLAKVLVVGSDRADAVGALSRALDATTVDGVATNLAFLRDAARDPRFVEGGYPTSLLIGVDHRPNTIEVLEPGMQTTVQDLPGRLGYWAIGVPPSGPMDDLAFRHANRLVGNAEATAGVEITSTGPTLRFDAPALVALTGAPMAAQLDGTPIAWSTSVHVEPGSTLEIGAVIGGGCRAYLAVRGGFDAAPYLGSRSTFLLGGFGGAAGRALRAGDVLGFGAETPARPASVGAEWAPPEYGNAWEIGVLDGPHGAPDFFTPAAIDAFFTTAWTVHHHSDRTGVRLLGPKPEWARADGGEAGLHPSNIHDTPYAVGTVDFTGDMPVVLGPDGPSLGGFVCPATVVTAERWKLGQLTAGDTVRFTRVGTVHPSDVGRPVLRHDRPVARPDRPGASAPEVTYRQAGDACVLVEYGDNVLDLALRFRVHALGEALTAASAGGIEELAPGIRSLQVRFDPTRLSASDVVSRLRALEPTLPDGRAAVVPSRIVHLPLSWDDPATRLATERYVQVVRNDAPWCPWNIEFIRRINGLDDVDDVRRVVFDASYLVLGLGDVYLGAPVATPLDPRHRLVTTKYNPARTWTPENAVGIGGAYLCVYGMEGPGGYQFVGRTVQMWNRHRRTADFPGSRRWLLRWFDQLRFFPVSAEELLDLRRDFAVGRYQLEIEESSLSLAEHEEFLAREGTSIAVWQRRQQDAFAAERERWDADGEFERTWNAEDDAAAASIGDDLPAGSVGVTTPVHGVVACVAAPGDSVAAGDALVVVEAMKTETKIVSPAAGTVAEVRCSVGQLVAPGPPLVVMVPS